MTAYEMRISDWSSDVCSSDLPGLVCAAHLGAGFAGGGCLDAVRTLATAVARRACNAGGGLALARDRPRRRHAPLALAPADRKSGVLGRRVPVRVALGGRRTIQKTQQTHQSENEQKPKQ